MLRSASASLALLVVLIACGGETATDDSTALTTTTTSADELAPPAPAIAPGDAAAISALCVTGDPTQGVAWQLGFADSTLRELPFTSIGALASRDSSRLAVQITRAVDVLPTDSSALAFRGLPVTVRDAWRLLLPSGDTSYVAVVARRLAMESNPREEQIVMLGEPDHSAMSRGGILPQWTARGAGPEETVATHDLVGAFLAADATPRLVVVRESDAAPQFILLTRGTRWEERWTGNLERCAATP